MTRLRSPSGVVGYARHGVVLAATLSALTLFQLIAPATERHAFASLWPTVAASALIACTALFTRNERSS